MDQQSLIDDFLSFKKDAQGVADSTTQKYKRHLLQLEKWLGEPLQSASRTQLEAFCGSYAHHKLGLSPTARRPLISAVRGFYAWMLSHQHTKTNPSALIPYPRTGRKLPLAMSLHNAERLIMQPDLTTFTGLRDATIISLLIACGCRISGIVKLNESNLRWSNDALSILFDEKGGRERLVPVHADAMWMLRAYLAHEVLSTVDRSLHNGDKVLFISTRNRNVPLCDYFGETRRIRTRSIDAMIKRYGRQAEIPDVELHAHSIRHLFGAELAESNVDILVRQVLLGHADPKTTEIYTHIAQRKLAEAATKASPLAKIMNPVKGLVSTPSAGS